IAMVGITTPACVDDGTGIEDGFEEDFADAEGKADGYSLSEAQATAVMAAADTLAVEQLKSEVGLSTRAAKYIANYVAGADKNRGTADDQQFDSLEELDGVAYVGPQALAALVEYAKTAGLVRSDFLGRHDVSVLYPLTKANERLIKASDAAQGGALLPKSAFDKIGRSLVNTVEDDAEYDALRAFAVRFDPCFQTALASKCQPQIRIVFQTFNSADALVNDGSVHALYNLTDAEFADVTAQLRTIAPSAHKKYRPLGVSPALAAQGADGEYGQKLKAVVLAHAGATNLARMTFMTRENARQGLWVFGGFHIKAQATTGFPSPGPISIFGSTLTEQTVSNRGFGSFAWTLTPEFADADGRKGTDAAMLATLPAKDKAKLYAWTQRQLSPKANVPDTTDCGSCHMAGHPAQVLEKADSKLKGLDRGPRVIGASDTGGDNLRAFGYFFKDAVVSIRAANETAAVVRAMNH
ncbi:MAG: hypothetical protein KBG15_24695, partial [Kofleriaceae bacterium]|nr:hypothetical protein [Kofleriaceae bacterium]